MIPILEGAGMIAGLITGVLDRVLPKKMTEQERAAVELELMKVDWQSTLGQLEINKVEAASESMFVAGWRPFVGWTCGSSLAWAAVIRPILEWLLAAGGVQVPALPQLATELTTPILGALLGLGGMRTFEKFKGVSR